MRLIDADALMKELEHEVDLADDWKTAHEIANVVKYFPAIETEIIKCKDCKKNPNWEWVGCPMAGKDTRKPDDFCSYGERR